MKELNEIYEHWSNTVPESSGIMKAWLQIEKHLPAPTEDMSQPNVRDYIMEYALALERQGFIAGYQKAMHLIAEVFEKKTDD